MDGQARIMMKTEDFRAYCASFYSPGGVYSMGATHSQIASATITYIERLKTSQTETWGGGDSLDRERVRDILIQNFGLEMSKPKRK